MPSAANRGLLNPEDIPDPLFKPGDHVQVKSRQNFDQLLNRLVVTNLLKAQNVWFDIKQRIPSL